MGQEAWQPCYVEARVRTSMAALHAPAWSRGKLPFTAHDNKRKQYVLATLLYTQTMHRRGWGGKFVGLHGLVGEGWRAVFISLLFGLDQQSMYSIF